MPEHCLRVPVNCSDRAFCVRLFKRAPCFPTVGRDRVVMPVVWQVFYEVRGVPYWWDYPLDVAAELEKQYPNGGHIEWAWVWPQSRNPPSGSIAFGATPDEEMSAADDDKDTEAAKDQTHGSLYHLYPSQKLQLNLTSNQERPMRRIEVLDQ